MRYLHTMVRVRDLPAALRFFCEGLGLREIRRRDSEQGRFTLVFLGEKGEGDSPQIELTYNWDQQEPYTGGRNFGHVASFPTRRSSDLSTASWSRDRKSVV